MAPKLNLGTFVYIIQENSLLHTYDLIKSPDGTSGKTPASGAAQDV